MVGVALERVEGPGRLHPSTELRLGPRAPIGELRGEAVRCSDPARDIALQTAFDSLTGGRHTDHDAPDAWVTAVRVCQRSRRIRTVPGRHRRATARGTRCTRHRGALHASGGCDRPRARASQRRHHHAHRLRQDALLQRARPECDPSGSFDARALPVSNQSARAGSTGGIARTGRAARDDSRPVGVFTYDGDTPQDASASHSRPRAHRVEQPDMVHSGSSRIIPAGPSCSRTCATSIIDELHAYRGVFGSHLTNVLRRLRRICRHYGSDPTFICSSATIANPRELAEALVERPFELVSESGAPRGEKFVPLRQPARREPAARHPAVSTSPRLAASRRSS